MPSLLEEPLLKGWLSKKSHNKMVANVYQKRFFMLTSYSLSYAKKANSVDNEYPLNDVDVVKLCGEENLCRELEVSFRSFRVLQIKAPDSSTATDWVNSIERCVQSCKGSEQGGSPSSPIQTESQEADQVVSQYKAYSSQAEVKNMRNQEEEEEEEDGSGCASESNSLPSPPAQSKAYAPLRSSQGALNLNLDLDTELDQQGRQAPKPPSPRSMLANPQRFGAIMAASPKQQPSSPPKVEAQTDGQDPVQSWSQDSESDKSEQSPKAAPKPAQSHMPASHQAGHQENEPQGSSAGSELSLGFFHVARNEGTGVASRAVSGLTQSIPRQSSLRPRLVLADAPLPEAVPRPGLHHAISLQKEKAQNSRGSSARSERQQGGSADERLELDTQALDHKRLAARQYHADINGSSAQVDSRGNSQPVSQPGPYDPEHETLVLGPNPAQARAPNGEGPYGKSCASYDGRASLNSSSNSVAKRDGGDHSSLQSSLGSARNAAPRLLSGAASRAPPQLDEHIELPPPNYPKSTAVAGRPPMAPVHRAAGRQAHSSSNQTLRQQREEAPVNRAEIQENWDSDEEGELEQHAKAPTHRVQHPQQPHRQEDLDNSWDDDNDAEDKGGAIAPVPPPTSKPGPSRPVPPPATAPKGPAPTARGRQQFMLRLQEQQDELELRAQQRTVSEKQRPSAGVTEDANFVEENWDSDE